MIKRRLVLILAAVFILCTMTSAMAYTTMYVYTANGKSLNLRNAPGYYGDIMTTIPYGAAVRVNDTFNGTWYSVTYNGYTGYAMSCYLVSSYIPYSSDHHSQGCIPTPDPDSDSDTDSDSDDSDSDADEVSVTNEAFLIELFSGFQTVYYKAMVDPDNAAGYVNLYWAPSLLSDIHAQYYANEILIVMSQNSLWCQVLDEEDNVMGYMLRQFLTAYYYGDS